MTISVAAFTNGITAGTASSAATASKTWVAAVYALWVMNYLSTGSPSTPTVETTTGLVAFSQLYTVVSANGDIRMSLFAFLGAGTTETATIAFGGVTQTRVQWTCDKLLGTKQTGTNGTDAFVATNINSTNGTTTAMSTTLSAFADPVNNAAYAWGWNQGGASETVGTGYTGVSTNTGFFVILGEYKLGQDTAPSMTQSSANSSTLIAAELAAAGGGGGSTFAPPSLYVQQAINRAATFYAPRIRVPEISLAAYYRERARAQREFLRRIDAGIRRAA